MQLFINTFKAKLRNHHLNLNSILLNNNNKTIYKSINFIIKRDYSNNEEIKQNQDSLDKNIDKAFSRGTDFKDDSSKWSTSFYGVGSKPFEKEIVDILLAPLNLEDIEIKPDGLLYLPEIKYRRILNKAFGPGGWGLVPRGPSTISGKNISREYALICQGRFVSQARGEQTYFDENDISMAAEGAKSNALTRCCKDIGIASELWDPSFIRKFRSQYCEPVWVEHVTTKKKRQIWRLKNAIIEYPYKLSQY